jgi:hypothetical protein
MALGPIIIHSILYFILFSGNQVKTNPGGDRKNRPVIPGYSDRDFYGTPGSALVRKYWKAPGQGAENVFQGFGHTASSAVCH